MVLGLLYNLVRSLLDLLVLCRKTEAALQIEVLALRDQLGVLERQVRRPRFQPADRLVLSALRRNLLRPAWPSFLVRPETLLRWSVGTGRCTLGGPRAATWSERPAPSAGPSLGPGEPEMEYRRIQGELLKLGALGLPRIPEQALGLLLGAGTAGFCWSP
jgi:putative transposase